MNTSKIARYVWIGKKDFNWYRDCEDLFIELFGCERLPLVTKLFAATSINTSLKANITLFRRALHEIERGIPRSKYLPNIEQQLDQVRAGGELTGRKIRSFARAMSGDTEAVVVDIWLLRAFDMDRKYFRKEPPSKVKFREVFDERGQPRIGVRIEDPHVGQETIYPGAAVYTVFKKRGLMRSGGASDGQYTKIETYVREEARAMGIQPRQLCAMIWSGVRIDQGGDRETHYKTILRQKMYNLFDAL